MTIVSLCIGIVVGFCLASIIYGLDAAGVLAYWRERFLDD